MEDDIKNVLIENAREYYRNGVLAELKKEYNSSVTLFFKCISALADLFVFLKEGKIPSSHTDRFRILELRYQEVYKIVDNDFPFYQGSYRSKLNFETSEMLRQDAEKLFKLLKIDF